MQKKYKYLGGLRNNAVQSYFVLPPSEFGYILLLRMFGFLIYCYRIGI